MVFRTESNFFFLRLTKFFIFLPVAYFCIYFLSLVAIDVSYFVCSRCFVEWYSEPNQHIVTVDFRCFYTFPFLCGSLYLSHCSIACRLAASSISDFISGSGNLPQTAFKGTKFVQSKASKWNPENGSCVTR